MPKLLLITASSDGIRRAQICLKFRDLGRVASGSGLSLFRGQAGRWPNCRAQQGIRWANPKACYLTCLLTDVFIGFGSFDGFARCLEGTRRITALVAPALWTRRASRSLNSEGAGGMITVIIIPLWRTQLFRFGMAKS